MEFYSFDVVTSSGERISLSQYKGKPIIVVNTATQCSLTPQFAGLEKLYEDYKDKGLVILGFPSNQISGQEPIENKDMSTFCKLNHGVTFQLMEKIKVNGKEAHPLYHWLKHQKRGWFNLPIIRWNFEKFLINPEGEVVKRFSPWVKPYKLEPYIKKYI